ncbi:glucose PTS transporter subunit IIA [Thermoanaerobacterium thermosaccharolyticum]
MKGKAVSLNEVPDQTFAEGIIGKGIAIIPEDGVVVSPVDGTVAHMFETKHAVAVVSDSGIEVLIHVGIDTVKMNGEGFKSFVNTGDRVKAGDKLLEVDLNLVNERAKSTITPIVITNTDKCKNVKELKKGFVDFKDEIISVEF